jgi:Tfp pilus assembly protein PilE
VATRGVIASTRAGAEHQSFLRHAHFRWLKIASAVSLLALVVYLIAPVDPRPNGGTWYGYTLGTIGVLLILWLTMLGVRKRNMTKGRWSLKAWTSAHVYLGLSLLVIGTLHTGFQFDWNIHTLAYALMIVVIVSGIFGIAAYAALPRMLSDNRGETTQAQMLDNLRLVDRQLHDAAQPLDQHHADIVRMSLEDDPFAGGVIARLTRRYPRCGTVAAQAMIRRATGHKPAIGADPLEKVDVLLERKQAALARVRRHLQIKALLEVWLYVHVPLTFALIAALSAHVVSVFFYW